QQVSSDGSDEDSMPVCPRASLAEGASPTPRGLLATHSSADAERRPLAAGGVSERRTSCGGQPCHRAIWAVMHDGTLDPFRYSFHFLSLGPDPRPPAGLLSAEDRFGPMISPLVAFRSPLIRK